MMDETLQNLITDYLAHPLDTTRRAIICDRLEDLGDYRLQRLKTVEQVNAKAVEILSRTAKIKKMPPSTETIDDLLGMMPATYWRLFVCTLIRNLPMYYYEEFPKLNSLWAYLYQELRLLACRPNKGIPFSNCLHKSVVAGELFYAHLIGFGADKHPSFRLRYFSNNCEHYTRRPMSFWHSQDPELVASIALASLCCEPDLSEIRKGCKKILPSDFGYLHSVKFCYWLSRHFGTLKPIKTDELP